MMAIPPIFLDEVLKDFLLEILEVILDKKHMFFRSNIWNNFQLKCVFVVYLFAKTAI